MLDRLAVVNVFLVLFNMIPAFPMDGGRVLRAALASRLGYVRATEIAATIGQWVAFGLGFLGLFGNPLLIFIAIFVYLAAASEAQLVAVRAMSRGVPVRAAMMTQFATLPPDATIDEAVETLLRTSQNEFPVVDGAGRPVGVLGRNDLIRALKQRGPDARVSDAMTARLPAVSHRACLDEAFRVLQEKSAPAVGVVDADGRLVGLVTSETIAEMLMVQEALPNGVRLGPVEPPGRRMIPIEAGIATRRRCIPAADDYIAPQTGHLGATGAASAGLLKGSPACVSDRMPPNSLGRGRRSGTP